MAILYVIVSCFLLIWFRWRQELQGRSYPFVGISCLYWMWVLANGSTIPLDGITFAGAALVLWMIASILWTQKPSGAFEIVVWFSYLTIFLAARTIPIEVVLWILLINPAIFAALQLYYQIRAMEFNHDQFPVFGNSNHNASFMLVGFYAALWMAVEGIYPLFGIAFLIGVAIIKTRCRGATIALIGSLLLALILFRSEEFLYITIIFTVVAIPTRNRLYDAMRGNEIQDRVKIYKDAIRQIHPKYITGRGMNYFRDLYYGRVHNDHLEIIGELGLVGYFLFLNIFFQMDLDVMPLCYMVSFFIAGLFFFPLREVHTAVPFWAFMGSVGVPWNESLFAIKLAGGFAALMVMIFTLTIFSNLVKWSNNELRCKDGDSR